MTSANAYPNLDRLRRFILLKDLSEEQFQTLTSAVDIEYAPAGSLLIKVGSHDNFSFLLLEGTIQLKAQDGREMDLTSEHPSALSPIARLLPRRYDVISVTPVQFLRIDNDLLHDVTSQTQDAIEGYQVSGEQEGEATEFENQISFQFLQDLNQDKLKLPSLPEVAVRIGRAMEDGSSDASDIAKIIQTDPVITAKMIKVANSALYGGQTPVETCSTAVVRLGTKLTHKMVLTFALQDLFKPKSGILQKRMQELWKHSTKVAALCYVLAKHDSRFDPEHALLAGLMHDIGVVAVLDYAKDYPEEIKKPKVLDHAINRLRAQTGSMILSQWGFPTEFIVCTLECEDWTRDKGDSPDYCDLVIISQLHSFVGTEMAMKMPAINQIPAHNRLALGELTPQLSLKLLEEAKDQIAIAESLLQI
ncbi:MAG: HDOD domain-containing protein [Gammaproteobacteria bacterium]|nr:HDOD domain-containing protein [Gammaproteobacteria bacterium]